MSAELVAVPLLALVPLALVKAPFALLKRFGVNRTALRLLAMELTFLTVAVGYLLATGGPVIGIAAPTPFEWGLVATGVAANWVLAVVFGVAFEWAGVDTSANGNGLSDGDSGTEGVGAASLPALLAVSLVVGPAEELLYRGVVQGTFAAHAHPATAILGATVLFSAIHYPTHGADSWRDVDRGTLVGMFFTGLGGLVAGTLYVVTGNVVVPALQHTVHVAILFAFEARTAKAGAEPAEATTATD